MTCKDCIHYGVCGGFTPTDLDTDVFDYCREGRTDEIPDIEWRCNDFKPKSRYIELPCAVGDTVYIIDEGDGECTEDYVLDVKVQELILTEKGLACVLKLPLGMRCSMYTKIGVNVFLTKEEAEKAIKEKQQ